MIGAAETREDTGFFVRGGGGKKNHVLLRYHRGSVGCLR